MFLFIFALFCLSADAAITVTPLNQVAIVGHQTFFNCSTTGSTSVIRWRFEPLYGSACTVMQGSNVGDCNQPRFSVSEPTAGQYNLVINNTALSDVGIFICDDTLLALTVSPVSAVYGVIESNHVVESSVSDCLLEEQTAINTCKVTYNGSNLMPLVMTWTNSSGQQVPSNSTNNTANGLFQSTTYVTAGRSNIQPYTCTVSFTAPTGNASQLVPPPKQATNSPSYTSAANSSSYNVQYCPYSIDITMPAGKDFPGGYLEESTSLTCSVSGGSSNVNTTYKWTDGSGAVVSNNQTVTVPAPNNNTVNYTCIANSTTWCSATRYKLCDVLNKTVVVTSTVIKPNAETNDTSSCDTTCIILCAVLIPCGCGGIIIIIVCCCCPSCPGYGISATCRRKCRRNKGNGQVTDNGSYGNGSSVEMNKK